jgi:AcrR family transcriptional regulator
MTSGAVPRRRDSAATKARILLAARRSFAEHGYAAAGLRGIAADAGVASSLLVRYYGSKAALFEEALVATIRDHSVFASEKAGFGAAMARLVIERGSIAITTMLVTALADPDTRAIAMRVSREHMVGPLAEWLGGGDAQARAFALFSLLTGFTVQTRSVAEGEVPEPALAWLAASLQAIVDEAG